MKKILALVMALSMVFALAACGQTEGNESDESIEEVIIISSNESSTTDTSSSAPVTNTSSQASAACTHKNVQTIPAVAATCNAEGKTEGKVCKDCGAVIVAQNSISKEDHIWLAATETTPRTCKLCGATQGSVVGPTAPEAKVKGAYPITKNGATITVTIGEVKYVEGGSKCEIFYNVKIINGSTQNTFSWTAEAVQSDNGKSCMPNNAPIKETLSTPLAPNEVFNKEYSTGPVNLVGPIGYSLDVQF